VAVVDRLLERDTVFADLHRCRRAAARGCGRVVWLLAETAAFLEDRDLGMFEAFVVALQALASLSRGDWASAARAAEQVLTRPELTPPPPDRAVDHRRPDPGTSRRATRLATAR
jgi:hypothetical protein